MGLHRNVLSLFPSRCAGRGESSAGHLAVNDATLTIFFFHPLPNTENSTYLLTYSSSFIFFWELIETNLEKSGLPSLTIL